MSDSVIHAEGLGKAYLIGHQGRRERYTALRDVDAARAKTVFAANRAGYHPIARQMVAGILEVEPGSTGQD